MNKINHFLFSFSLTLLFVEPDFIGLAKATLFSLVFGVLIDLDHLFNKKASWYMKRTWIQEPTGLIIIGVPLGLFLGFFDQTYFWLVVFPYASHILLDYLCIFAAKPLSPFLDIVKKEGWGIFIPDTLFSKSENSKRWAKRVKEKRIRGVSENYFTPLAVIFFVTVLALKAGIV